MKAPALVNKLSWKISGAIILITLIFFSITAYISIANFKNILEKSYMEKAETIARTLDANIRNSAELKDKARLFSIIQKYLWLDPDIINIEIFLPIQESLISICANDPEKVGLPADDDNWDAFNRDIIINRITLSDSQRHMRVYTPIHIARQLVGTYRIELTLEEMDSRILNFTKIISLIFFLIGLVSTVLAYGLLKYLIIRPISLLNSGVEAVSKGDLDKRVEIVTKDEIGELALTFNQMTRELKNSHQSLETHSVQLARRIEEKEVAEEKLRKSHQELESRVSERTVELRETNEQLHLEIKERIRSEEERVKLEFQLRQSQKMEAIGTLAGGIAHDFNNILGTLIGYTDLLFDLLPDNTTEISYLKEIHKASERAADLVRQILDFSRVETYKLQPLRLQTLIEESSRLITASLPSTILVQKTIDQTCGPVLAYASQIEQIIVNLSTNAAHAMKNSDGILDIGLEEVHLEAETEAHPNIPPGRYVQLTIKDNGTGMSDDIKERIFEPFFTTKAVNEGTGLGLSVVHGIVKSHKGVIKVDSALGKGTSFSIFFPLTTEVSAERESDQVEVVRGKGHIIVVEDETPLRRFYCLALNQLGYDVIEFKNGLETFDYFRDHANEIDLIITDQIMPFLTGTQLCKKIHKIRSDIPVILISGHPQNMSHSELKISGVTRFIYKPIKISTLAQIVQQTLKN